MTNRDVLTTTEASRLCGMSAAKIRRLIQLGRLPAKNTSTGQRPRYAIRRVDLDAFFEPDNVPAKSPQPAAIRRQRIDRDVPQVF